MAEQLSKVELLDDLRLARTEWDELVSQVGETHLAQAGAEGYWSVKDVIAHLTAVDRWMVNALQAHLQDEPPPAVEEQLISLEERNRQHFEQNRNRPIQAVLAESRRVFEQLFELVQQQPEAFLIQPQIVENVPEPVILWKTLKEAHSDHYRHHMPALRQWLAKLAEES
jgi:hypothetical protein